MIVRKGLPNILLWWCFDVTDGKRPLIEYPVSLRGGGEGSYISTRGCPSIENVVDDCRISAAVRCCAVLHQRQFQFG